MTTLHSGKVFAIMVLTAAAVLVVGAGVGAAATTWYVDDGGDQTIAYDRSYAGKTTVASPAIDNNTIVVDIKLLNIPETLTFDQEFTPDNACEHEWGIYIDLDNNPSTGSSYRVEGCERNITTQFLEERSTTHGSLTTLLAAGIMDM
jgi:hypothetical protein